MDKTCGTYGEGLIGRIDQLEAENAQFRNTLEAYAELQCEYGFSHPGCGKYDDDVCAGCAARSVLLAHQPKEPTR